MATRRKVAFALYLINAVVLLGFGLRYFFARDLMGYHAVTIGAPAASLSDAHQLVFITLYRATGAGMLTVAVTIVVLLLLPFRAGERWSRWALTGVGLFYSLLSLFLTLALQVDTAASIPRQGPAIAVVTLVLAHALAGDTASTQ